MKKYILIVATIFLASCSSSESDMPLQNSLPKLVKIIFDSGGSENFNEDGLLTDIRNSSGVVTQNFIYDSNNNLITTTRFGNTNYTTTFTYDASDRVTSVNGNPMNFDSANNRYFIDYNPVIMGDPNDYENYWEMTLTNEGLPIQSTVYYGADGATFPYHYSQFNYANGNMTAYTTSDDIENHYTFDSNPNPLKQALLPITKVMSLAGDLWKSGNVLSNNNCTGRSYAAKDPESFQTVYTYNSLGLPVTETTQRFYLGTLEATFGPSHYYYVGDVIP